MNVVYNILIKTLKVIGYTLVGLVWSMFAIALVYNIIKVIGKMWAERV